ncbi:MAG: N-6 DNA methylase [Rivularia sp. (in: Bacteria)]|nr:N-6 DNA methylase [Rivularia sp. MS3]
MAPRKNRRSENRCRYYVRREAERRGWDLRYVGSGGDVLEEQEIEAYFADVGLTGDRPDFLFCLAGNPTIIVEAKNQAGKLKQAQKQAEDYANKINAAGKYKIKLAVAAAGEEDKGFEISVSFLTNKGWTALTSHEFAVTTFPTKAEVETALKAEDGSTTVSVPSQAEFVDAAIETSRILRTAKIEAPLRPKVIGAVVLAMYEGQIDNTPSHVLQSVNELVKTAIDSVQQQSEIIRERLKDALRLSGADFNRLAPYIGRIINTLNRLNVRSVIQTDADFLGMFYEAFLRYGYDNNALGIVFTPRHITRMCVDLIQVSVRDQVIDISAGTGGFLVSAFDAMKQQVRSAAEMEKVKDSIVGFDTNPTVWALSMLNMLFRGDGKSHIYNESCFDDDAFAAIYRKCTRAFLNPPFSQDEEPEYLFIDRAMDALKTGGLMAAVVYAGIFADKNRNLWRQRFLLKHKLLAIISLPEDLFYPTAAPSSIMIAEAHVPLAKTDRVFMARIWNDGYEKLKGKRVERSGNQIDEVVTQFHAFMQGKPVTSELVTTIGGADILL